MIISHTKKFGFIHVPKAGGTSVRSVLSPYATVGVWQHKVGSLAPNPDRRMSKHAKAGVVRSVIGADVWSSLFTFAFVRNPWDRLVSNYFYAKEHPKSAKYIFVANRTFTEFVEWHAQNRTPPEALRIDPQFAYLSVSNKIIMSKVYKLEKVDEAFAAVCKRLGIKNTLPHINRSKHRDYRSYYTSDTKNMVKKIFEKDIDYFRYTF